MKSLFRGRNRLLFRSYLLLVGGLLIVAIVLDLGFSRLQSNEQPDTDRWLESTFRMIEFELQNTPREERAATTQAISEQLGIDVQLLEQDEVHINDMADQPVRLVDTEGNTSYLHNATSIDAIIRLGPIAEPEDGLLLKLLPPLFYLSIFVLVGLWLRPLLKDINIIQTGAQRFAADYREPLATADKTTELKPLAKNLDEMAKRLSGVLRSQKELIAALSHEMRTPLARLRFALAVSGDKADKALKEKLAAMNDDVQEIDDLIAAMLNYARLDHPDIEMHWQNVPTSAWLGQIIEKNTTETIQLEGNTENAPETINMDPRLMELALSNLLFNATKYARKNVKSSLKQHGNSFELTVEDDGQGIPEEARENIFKAFTRIDDSRNRETGGYGLGLAIVARVAELHGGSASVSESTELNGARFSVRWPNPAD